MAIDKRAFDKASAGPPWARQTRSGEICHDSLANHICSAAIAGPCLLEVAAEMPREMPRHKPRRSDARGRNWAASTGLLRGKAHACHASPLSCAVFLAARVWPSWACARRTPRFFASDKRFESSRVLRIVGGKGAQVPARQRSAAPLTQGAVPRSLGPADHSSWRNRRQSSTPIMTEDALMTP